MTMKQPSSHVLLLPTILLTQLLLTVVLVHDGLAADSQTTERTNRPCDMDALSRVADTTFCDKYFVCLNGTYVGLFCPKGYAFDYGQQTCRPARMVDCSKRPQFANQGVSVNDTTVTPTPGTTAGPGSGGSGKPANSNMKILRLGGRVIIPSGSTLLLPAGAQIEEQEEEEDPVTFDEDLQYYDDV